MSESLRGEAWEWERIVVGEPASKANSRRLVYMGKTPRFIKSKKALQYEKMFLAQVPTLEVPLLEGPLEAEITMWMASRRPDNDPALILDLLQKARIYRNDRQVEIIHSFRGLDRKNPHSRIRLRRLPEDFSLPC